MNETLKLGLVLMIISLIASFALAFTNYFTEKQIEKQKMLAQKESLSKVMKADSFKEQKGYYEAYDEKGNLIGKVFIINAPGYSSVINAMVGVDLKGNIQGVDVVSQAETPGLGANIEKESFLKQFMGKKADTLKVKKDGGEIDAITGATISSRAITDGIRGAIGKDSGIADMATVVNVSKNSNKINESLDEELEIEEEQGYEEAESKEIEEGIEDSNDDINELEDEDE